MINLIDALAPIKEKEARWITITLDKSQYKRLISALTMLIEGSKTAQTLLNEIEIIVNKENDMHIKPQTYQELDGMRIIIEQLSSLTYFLTTHDEVDKEIAPALRHIHAHLHKLSENMQAVLNEIEEASLEAIDEA